MEHFSSPPRTLRVIMAAQSSDVGEERGDGGRGRTAVDDNHGMNLRLKQHHVVFPTLKIILSKSFFFNDSMTYGRANGTAAIGTAPPAGF